MTIKQRADELLGWMTEIRHDLHMHPELGMQEFRTTDVIARELDKLGLSYVRFQPTGLMCDIKGDLPGDGMIGLRADIDALAIQENSGIDFQSVNDGFMHACGHDMHASMLLGAAKILSERRSDFGGTVRLIFQPGEEGFDGAEHIIAQGAADGPQKYMAIHVWPNHDGHGEIGAFEVYTSSGITSFQIHIEGKACHSQSPQLGVDALVVAAQVILAAQTLVSRRIGPMDIAVVSICQMKAGIFQGAVAGEADMNGILRYRSEEIGRQFREELERLVRNISSANGATGTVTYSSGMTGMVNDPELEAMAYRIADEIWGGKAPTLNAKMDLGGEDFTSFAKRAPGVLVKLGAGGDKMGHQPDFVIYDEAMPYGASMYAMGAIEMLKTL